MTCGIYLIVNLVNDKFYVGSAVNVEKRWNNHTSALDLGVHDNKHLQSAWNKYGEDTFGFSVLEEVGCKDNLLEREQFWMDYTKCYNDEIGYNIRSRAESQLGIKWSEESREKFRRYRIGRKASEETKKKLSLISKERQRLNPTKRDRENWPCESGSKCKCENCLSKTREYKRLYYHRNYSKNARLASQDK